MNLLQKLSCLAAVAFATVPFASAETLVLASFGTTASAPSGVVNSATTLGASGATYNVGSNGVWTPAVGNSSWISVDPQGGPNGSYVAPTGTYTYLSSFTDLFPTFSSGTITVMADDTASVFLNDTLIVAQGPATYPRCSSGTPNCITPTTYVLPTATFVYGINTLRFDVVQGGGSSTGLDYVATVTTPEPASLLLLSTGLLGAAGTMARRLRLRS